MIFTVRMLRRAENDFRLILTEIEQRSRPGALAWTRAFEKALTRLEEDAAGFPVAAEDEHVDDRIQEILFRTRRGLIYRGLFTIREQNVYLLHIRGPGQNELNPRELSLPPGEYPESGQTEA